MDKTIISIEAARKNDNDVSIMLSLQGTPEETQLVMTDIVLRVNDAINNCGVTRVKNGFWLCMQENINDELEKRAQKA